MMSKHNTTTTGATGASRGHINVYSHIGESSYLVKRWFNDLDDARIFAMARFGRFFIEQLGEREIGGSREILASEWVIDGRLA